MIPLIYRPQLPICNANGELFIQKNKSGLSAYTDSPVMDVKKETLWQISLFWERQVTD